MYTVIVSNDVIHHPVHQTERLLKAIETACRIEELGFCQANDFNTVTVYRLTSERRYTKDDLREPLISSVTSAQVFCRWKTPGLWHEQWCNNELEQEYDDAAKPPPCPTLDEFKRLQIRQQVSAASIGEGPISLAQAKLLHHFLWVECHEKGLSVSKPSGLTKISTNCSEGFHIQSNRADFFCSLPPGEQIFGTEVIYFTNTVDPRSNEAAVKLKNYIESLSKRTSP